MHYGTLTIHSRISVHGSRNSALIPVHGEFVLMEQLVFGISRGNVSANDNVSARRLSIPESRSAFLRSPRMTAVLVVIVSESDQFHL